MLTEAVQRFLGVPPEPLPDFSITPERVACLARMLGNPTRYDQRFVEQVSFVSTGGQRWQRSLQLQIPAMSPHTMGRDWWIVPLGRFERRRLADIVVQDAHGARLNLLTRQQHGHALTDVITTNYLLAQPKNVKALMTGAIKPKANAFRSQLFSFFTAHGTTGDALVALRELASSIEEEYVAFAETLTLNAETQLAFRQNLFPWIETTQYLCWVKASPDEILNLQVTYTASDPNHELDIGTVPEAFKSLKTGLMPVLVSDTKFPRLRWSDEGRVQRAKWYRQYGLAPIDYEFEASSEVGSYYFTIEPPPYSSLTYLDWENGCHFHQTHSPDEAPEVTCAYPAVHVHTDENKGLAPAPTGKEGVTIRAYLRCTPYRHKQILGAAALNIAVVWLLAKGKLPPGLGEPLQGLIVAAPSVLIAFLTQQGRHYYSRVMRRQRAILWTYLTVSVAFLVSVAFSERDGSLGLGSFASVIAQVLAVSSGAIIGWHLLLGGSYERAVKLLARWKREKAEKNGEDTSRSMWRYYGDGARQYSFGIFVLTVALAALSGVSLYLWWGNASAKAGDQGSHKTRPAVSIQMNGVSIHVPRETSPAGAAPDTNPPPDTSQHRSGR